MARNVSFVKILTVKTFCSLYLAVRIIPTRNILLKNEEDGFQFIYKKSKLRFSNNDVCKMQLMKSKEIKFAASCKIFMLWNSKLNIYLP